MIRINTIIGLLAKNWLGSFEDSNLASVADFSTSRSNRRETNIREMEVRIDPVGLAGTLLMPEGANSLIVFAHGSGSSRFSPRNVMVAKALASRGMATLLFDLLLPAEEATRSNVFDINLLAKRLLDVVHWVDRDPQLRELPLGLFGASTGAAAALVAAAFLRDRVQAVVSRGGRPDLAGFALEHVTAPTLLIVGGADCSVIELNKQALERLTSAKELVIVSGATHLFEEPGAMNEVIKRALGWFSRYLIETPTMGPH